MIMKLVTIYILLLMLLLSCTSKKDSNIQATIDSLSIYDNHSTLEISEAKHLQWVDSVLGVKGVKLIDYRNRIYQYNDTRFYWNWKIQCKMPPKTKKILPPENIQ